jgi:hypothetical protein
MVLDDFLSMYVYLQLNKKGQKPRYKNVTDVEPVILKKVYFHQNKKRRKPKVKSVTLQLCEVKKSRYSFYEKGPTCAA